MAAIKTYAVLENHNESNRNDPYSYFVFPSLRELRNCKELNEYSIVFSNVEQLQNTFTEQELLSVLEENVLWCSILISINIFFFLKIIKTKKHAMI